MENSKVVAYCQRHSITSAITIGTTIATATTILTRATMKRSTTTKRRGTIMRQFCVWRILIVITLTLLQLAYAKTTLTIKPPILPTTSLRPPLQPTKMTTIITTTIAATAGATPTTKTTMRTIRTDPTMAGHMLATRPKSTTPTTATRTTQTSVTMAIALTMAQMETHKIPTRNFQSPLINADVDANSAGVGDANRHATGHGDSAREVAAKAKNRSLTNNDTRAMVPPTDVGDRADIHRAIELAMIAHVTRGKGTHEDTDEDINEEDATEEVTAMSENKDGNAEMSFYEYCLAYRNSYVDLLTSVLYTIVCIVGVFGNALVIYVVLRFSKMQTVTNIYILNLAIADECFLIGVPFLLYTMRICSWQFGEYMCKAYMVSTSITQFTSSIFLLIMSADRYIAVCHPIASPRYRTLPIAKCVAIGAWLISALLMLPVVLYASTVPQSFGAAHLQQPQQQQQHFSCNIDWPETHHAYTGTTFILYTLVLGFATPLCFILGFYCLVLRKLHALATKHRSKERKRSHRKITRLVLTVITVYVLCWLPHWISQVALIHSNPAQRDLSRFEVLVFLLLGCLVYSNSAMNPILYAFLSENFRKSFHIAFTCVARRDMNARLHLEQSVLTRQSSRRQLQRPKRTKDSQGQIARKALKAKINFSPCRNISSPTTTTIAPTAPTARTATTSIPTVTTTITTSTTSVMSEMTKRTRRRSQHGDISAPKADLQGGFVTPLDVSPMPPVISQVYTPTKNKRPS